MKITLRSIAAFLLLVGAPPQSFSQSTGRFQIDPNPFFDTGRGISKDSIVLLEPSGMTRLPDGTVVVGDNQANTVRFFSPTGRLLKNVGRHGGGPGEYQLVQLVGHCGTDSLLIFDGANSRLTFLTRTGALIGTRPLKSPPRNIGCNRTRTVTETAESRLSIPDEEIPHRGYLMLGVRTFGDSITRPLREIPGGERQRFKSSDGPRPLGKKTVVAVGSDRIYVATGDSAIIRAFDFRGTELPAVRLGFREIRIQRADVQSYLDFLVRRNPSKSAEGIRNTYWELEYPFAFPLVGEIRVDVDDRLWVEEYRRPWVTTSKWTVVARDGSIIGSVSLPDGFRLAEVGVDYLLGSWRDDDDVDHVRAYRFRDAARP